MGKLIGYVILIDFPWAREMKFCSLFYLLNVGVVQSLETAKALENFQVQELVGTAKKNIRDKYNPNSSLDKLFLNKTVCS